MLAVTFQGPPVSTAAPATEAREPHECLTARAGRRWAEVGVLPSASTSWDTLVYVHYPWAP